MATTEELLSFARNLYGDDDTQPEVAESAEEKKSGVDSTKAEIIAAASQSAEAPAASMQPSVERKEDDVIGEYFEVHHPNLDDSGSRMQYVEVDFEEARDELGLSSVPEDIIPSSGVGRMTFLEDNKRGVFTTSLTDDGGRLLSFAQVNGENKFRINIPGSVDLEFDVEQYIREHPRDFRKFCNETLREQRQVQLGR